ncbi:hypothetical protein SAY86_018876 [Trapa natans]|uniref:Bifunctional inhibitor/plant lipid transfer protein/seed storage helical domain-containing protein n=1 Tax=Trapa natans TaxID=22666 RepID=A0AAN7LK81_TRANT|nr:hypothetical protein SAY86_018876 [Trapa natans]
MEPSGKLVLVFMLIAAIFGRCHASTICNVPLTGLYACMPAVRSPYPPPPTVVCCNALLHVDYGCLCSYRDSWIIRSGVVNFNLALQVPGKCGLPFVGHC